MKAIQCMDYKKLSTEDQLRKEQDLGHVFANFREYTKLYYVVHIHLLVYILFVRLFFQEFIIPICKNNM